MIARKQATRTGSCINEAWLAAYYADFRQIARRALRSYHGRITLQPTDLAHEAALRLLAREGVQIRDEVHLLALAARVIRTTLIDEVRRRRAAKRSCEIVTLWNDHAGAALDVEEFDGLLEALADIEPDGARVVELRFYVGLTMEEIARTLGISESTALRRWRLARAWLFKELKAAA